VVNGKIVLVGGLLTGGGKNTTSAVRVYDPATNKWTSVSGSYPKRIIGQTGGYWNGRIYSTNGYSPDSEDNQKAYWGTVSGI
jgi:N-acetylneuraminic acid mutarotase